jgi:hypothetical protein
MSDEINLELQRLIDRFGRDEAENEPARLEAEARAARELDEWLGGLLAESEPADSGAPEELPDGEIDAELLQKIADWQRADEENEPARLEAEARELDELDALLDRLEAEPDL